MSLAKKIIVPALLIAYLLTPAVSMAASCCVCTIKVFLTDTQVFESITEKADCDAQRESLDDSWDKIVLCNIVEDTRCAAPEPEIITTKLEEEFKFSDVILGIKIPNLKFSAPPSEADEEGNIYIPWIGEYIKAVYNFALIAISIIAVVVLIIQGARIIVSAGGPQKSAAYKGITGAVIGLFIAWGSYIILFSINPDLVQFKSLQIKFIPTDPLQVELQTTEINTVDPSSDQPASGTYTPIFPDCPIQLSSPATFVAPQKEPRTLEFYDKISSIIDPLSSNAEKVARIADAAVKCGVHFGSCGRTAGTIYALAGLSSDACLNESKGCWTKGKNVIFSLRYNDRKWLKDVYCKSDTPLSTCANNRKEAKAIVYNKLKKEMPPGWPDSWANALQPGDYIIFYNGNSSPRGTHATLFVGWASNGKAQVIQGSWGKRVKMGTACIKSNCPSPAALIEATRP